MDRNLILTNSWHLSSRPLTEGGTTNPPGEENQESEKHCIWHRQPLSFPTSLTDHQIVGIVGRTVKGETVVARIEKVEQNGFSRCSLEGCCRVGTYHHSFLYLFSCPFIFSRFPISVGFLGVGR